MTATEILLQEESREYLARVQDIRDKVNELAQVVRRMLGSNVYMEGGKGTTRWITRADAERAEELLGFLAGYGLVDREK